jgi:protein-tyrosine phosphatase
MTKFLMVCMGNVCRSPMAQIVTLHLAQQTGVRGIQVDSAGTHASRGKEPPDPRAKAVLSARGFPIGKSRSRQRVAQDFERYDLILAMDQANLNDLRRSCPNEHAHKLRLFLEFAEGLDVREVPDPYYSNSQAFEHVLDLCEAGARGLVALHLTTPR